MAEERTRALRRHNDWTKAIRKRNIVRNWWGGEFGDWYDHLHQYSDNKIHCSCPLCSNKTNNKGKNGNKYAPRFNPSARDKRQLDNMKALLEESERLFEEIEEIN